MPISERKDPDLTIIIPVLDEDESIPELVDRIRSVCDGAGFSFNVWFVDDGSNDDSWDVIATMHERDARFAGLKLRRNYGKSAALALGFERADGKYVVTMDGDLQDDPAEIPGLIALLETGYDLVSGWKKKRHDPFTKTVPSRFFNFVTRRITGIPLHDFNCGLKAYRREVVKSVRLHGELHRYIPLLAAWQGYTRITEKVVQHHSRKHGRTKFGLERYLRGFLDLLTVSFMTRFASRPMHFFGSLGTLAFIGGILISLWISYDKMIHGNPIGDRPLLLLGVMLILVGVQMFSVGLIGQMIVLPRMERLDAIQIAGELAPDGRESLES
ncbi:MAG: glycosyltransferase family 2 protein [Bacteroidetes Order II. Incertae sedis bacterium]|jgi:glycosyltransferase involved in cell wall biosynthesis|nr:glycosyltransferase family 2 protein [Bacteroidetes Order II. bacterium]MBT4052820.1 glycosyltransferase family 2 protein [Bacteroidetes Order II. bacterium]MBT4603977.1 glycosyltransferase family 2 protein [Bacteroidetes Order II. bacterium]MBT5250871.1 glycosyltransferase family 2 protein [Bacteroidetes Order II. bacterium]MBT6199618.1 glycosyltransferase family 2 protein [Bacteroidetes Order II. bacterium]